LPADILKLRYQEVFTKVTQDGMGVRVHTTVQNVEQKRGKDDAVCAAKAIDIADQGRSRTLGRKTNCVEMGKGKRIAVVVTEKLAVLAKVRVKFALMRGLSEVLKDRTSNGLTE
jgi:hypothetical protein